MAALAGRGPAPRALTARPRPTIVRPRWTALTISAAPSARLLLASAQRWLRPSFLLFEMGKTPGQRGRQVSYGFGAQALRYADTGEAGVYPARSGERAHVCVRADGL